MVMLGWKDEVEGTLVRELKEFSLPQKPEEMPPTPDPLFNIVCGQIIGRHEYLWVCETLEDVMQMFVALEEKAVDRIVWYIGVTRFPPENM